jgi:hypothetical protein
MTPKYKRWTDKARAVGLDAILDKRGIRLRRSGGELVGPCPVCHDGDDRFAVDVKRGLFNCRRCEKGGRGAIDLVMFFDGCDANKAAETINGEPPPKGNGKTNGKGGGAGKSSVVAKKYTYETADGTPYLQVHRLADKAAFPQYHWDGENWISGKPSGPKIPYMLPQLIAATPTTPIYVVEGEKDVDNLTAIGFVATCNSEGADNGRGNKWTADLNQYFKDRNVYILPDNDESGRKHAQHVARSLNAVAASVRVVELPGLPPKGDVSDWLKSDTAGVELTKLAEAAPLWQPGEEPGDEDDDADHPAGKPKQAGVLLKLTGSITLFHTPDREGYADIFVDGHRETHRVRGQGFKQWLRHEYFKQTKRGCNSNAMQMAIETVESMAMFEGAEVEVHIRVAEHDGAIYIDIGDVAWQAIKVTKTGWEIVTEPPVRFRRSPDMRALPVPQPGGKIELLKPLCNVSDDGFVLLVADALAVLRPNTNYPGLVIIGQPGACKTSLERVIRRLTDPREPEERSPPRTEDDLIIAAKSAHFLSFDNISGLSTWLSDAFCRLSTGGGAGKRRLYTDDEEVLFAGRRPFCLTGIEDVVTHPDLVERVVILAPEPIPERKRLSEKEFDDAFARVAPKAFAALLDGVAAGLRNLASVTMPEKPRMADFALWAEACTRAYWPAGTFLKAYQDNLAASVELVIENNAVADAVQRFMAERNEWTGTASELLP